MNSNHREIILRIDNANYIASHILKIDSLPKKKGLSPFDYAKVERNLLKSLWAIADATELFGEELGRVLTESQESEVWQFISEFRRTKKGKQAIETIAKRLNNRKISA